MVNKNQRFPVCVSFAHNQTRTRKILPRALDFIESTSSGSRVRQYDQVEKHVLLHSGRAGAVEKHLRLPTDQEHMRTFSTSSEENDGLELSAVAENKRPLRKVPRSWSRQRLTPVGECGRFSLHRREPGFADSPNTSFFQSIHIVFE